MKTIIIILAFIVSSFAYSQEKSYTFVTGDTTTTFTVQNAEVVNFSISDSSLTGTDSILVYYRTASPITGVYIYSPVAVHDANNTTATTNTNYLSPGNGVARTYQINRNTWGGNITGTFFIQRTNTRTGEAAYAPKTRMFFYAY